MELSYFDLIVSARLSVLLFVTIQITMQIIYLRPSINAFMFLIIVSKLYADFSYHGTRMAILFDFVINDLHSSSIANHR